MGTLVSGRGEARRPGPRPQRRANPENKNSRKPCKINGFYALQSARTPQFQAQRIRPGPARLRFLAAKIEQLFFCKSLPEGRSPRSWLVFVPIFE